MNDGKTNIDTNASLSDVFGRMPTLSLPESKYADAKIVNESANVIVNPGTPRFCVR